MKKKELTALKNLAAKNKTLLVLNNVLIKGGRAIATDLETTISFPCPNIKGTGLVPADIFAKADYESGEFKPDHSLELRRGRAAWSIQGCDPDEYVVVPEKGKKICKFSDVEQVRQAVPFAANDDLRPVMNGVYLGGSKVAATDAHWLITLKRKSSGLKGTIIPSQAVRYFLEDSYVAHEAKEGDYIYFVGERQHIAVRPVEGRYPNYPAVIPTKVNAKATVDRKQLLSAVEDAIPSADKQKKAGIFTFEDNKLTIRTEDVEHGTSYTEDIPMNWTEGDNRFRICLNVHYVEKILKYYKKLKNINIFLGEATRAAFIGDVLLMPILVDDCGWKNENNYSGVDSPIQPTIAEREEFYRKEEKPAEPQPEPQPEASIQEDEKIEDFSDTPEDQVADEPVSESNKEPQEEAQAEPTPEPQQEEETPQPPMLLEYSEKSIVVIGDTKPLRKKLKAQKGVWIPKGLKLDGQPIVGWIFSKKHREAVEQIING